MSMTLPTWRCLIPMIVDGLAPTAGVPTMKSCPTRWASDIPLTTAAAPPLGTVAVATTTPDMVAATATASAATDPVAARWSRTARALCEPVMWLVVRRARATLFILVAPLPG